MSVEGTNLVLLPNDIGEEGVATVTVTATDADGLPARARPARLRR